MMPRFNTLNEFFSGPFTLGNTQEIPKDLNKKRPKYLLVMDLDDADSDVREAESDLRAIEKEKEILEKWGFGREIPSELWGEITSRTAFVMKKETEVKRLEEELENYETA